MNGKQIRIFAAWMAALLFALSLGAAAASSAPESGEQALAAGDAGLSFGEGFRADRNGIIVVSLSGTWYEMGRQYGMLMKDRLEEVYEFVETIISYSIGNAEKAFSIIEKQTRQTPYRISRFFEGAAETSGLTVEELQAVNAVERIGGVPWTPIDLASFLCQ